MSVVKAADVAALRKQTGAGMMDCKQALTEADGDIERATELLRIKIGNKLSKLAGRDAAEGTVQSYIHATGTVGVLVEVNCNTDFVARNDEFVAFARELAMHIAASPQTRCVNDDQLPAVEREAAERVFGEQVADKPAEIQPKIIAGMLDKWLGEVVLLRQPHVNTDRYEGKTIEQLRDELSAKTGENVVISRFVRYAVGE